MQSQKALVAAALRAVGEPVFVAGVDALGSRITIHVASNKNEKEILRRAMRGLGAASGSVSVVVRQHKVEELNFPKSLEHLLDRVAQDQVLHDPTLIVSRARSLVAAARACRAKFGSDVDRFHFDHLTRTVFVTVKQGTPALSEEIKSFVSGRLSEPGADTLARMTVTVTSVLPNRRVVAIDAKSASAVKALASILRKYWLPGAIAVAMSTAAIPAAAAPVVDASSAKNFGVLAGLSVFSDGPDVEMSVFTDTGLKHYFGEIQVAQVRQRRDPNEVGQVGPGGVGS